MAQRNKVRHVENLRTDMKVQADEVYVLHLLGLDNGGHHVLHGNAKLVFGQPRSDVGVCVCSHVRVDAQRHVCHLAFRFGQLVDDLQFGHTFNVEAADTGIQSEVYFPIAFSYTSIHNIFCFKSCIQCRLYFATAHAVGAQTSLLYDVQNFGVGISFYSIMHMIVAMLGCLSVDSFQGVVQHLCVIIVEGCLYAFELANWKLSFHRLSLNRYVNLSLLSFSYLNSTLLKFCKAFCLSDSLMRNEML